MGDTHEALILLGFVVIIMGDHGMLQERRTDNALDALRDLSSPRAMALRDGDHRHAHSGPGGGARRRAAAGRGRQGRRGRPDLLQAHELATDESMLTGESEAVAQAGCPLTGSLPERSWSAARACHARGARWDARPRWGASAQSLQSITPAGVAPAR
jgi:magnesium-transporting ATPase (P-type)